MDLVAQPAFAEADWLAAVRIEELYPFPTAEIERILAAYRNLREVVWLQEEPRNMGAWTYVESHLRDLLPRSLPLRYIGRRESASPAEGSADRHAIEQHRLLTAALEAVPPSRLKKSEVVHAR